MNSDTLLGGLVPSENKQIDKDFNDSLDKLGALMVQSEVILVPAIQSEVILNKPVLETLDRYIAWKLSHAKRAAQCYRKWIERFYEFTQKTPQTIDGDDFVLFTNHLAEKYKVGSIQFALVALKDHCRWLEQKKIAKPPWELIKPPKGTAKHYPPIKRDDFLRMLSLIDPLTPMGLRNMVMMLLFWDCGIRVGEMARLTISEMDTEECTSLMLSEKSNGKRRRIFWSQETNGFLKKHIDTRRTQDTYDILFCAPQNKTICPIDPRSIQRIIKHYSEKAGCKITPHSLRTTWATERYRNGLDLKAIQWGLGHANLRTTMIYVQPEDAEMEAKLRSQLA